MDEIIECAYCGGDAYLMGTLGAVAHYRCRHCGMDSSAETGEFDFGMHEDDGEDFGDHDPNYGTDSIPDDDSWWSGD